MNNIASFIRGKVAGGRGTFPHALPAPPAHPPCGRAERAIDFPDDQNGVRAMNQAFLAAIDSDDVSTLQHLLAEQPDLAQTPDQDGVSPLLRAQYRRRAGAVAVLRAHLQDLTLHEAAALGDVMTIRALLDDGADIDEPAADGFTALHLSAFFGHDAAVELLLARGAGIEIDSAEPMRLRPLHAAAAGGVLRCVELLLARGAAADVRQQGDYTPLHSAAAAGNVEMVRVLLVHGAARDARASDGRTPSELARQRGHFAVVDLLGP